MATPARSQPTAAPEAGERLSDSDRELLERSLKSAAQNLYAVLPDHLKDHGFIRGGETQLAEGNPVSADEAVEMLSRQPLRMAGIVDQICGLLDEDGLDPADRKRLSLAYEHLITLAQFSGSIENEVREKPIDPNTREMMLYAIRYLADHFERDAPALRNLTGTIEPPRKQTDTFGKEKVELAKLPEQEIPPMPAPNANSKHADSYVRTYLERFLSALPTVGKAVLIAGGVGGAIAMGTGLAVGAITYWEAALSLLASAALVTGLGYWGHKSGFFERVKETWKRRFPKKKEGERKSEEAGSEVDPRMRKANFKGRAHDEVNLTDRHGKGARTSAHRLLNNPAESLHGVDLNGCKVIQPGTEFKRHLWVTDPYVITGRDARLERFDAFLANHSGSAAEKAAVMDAWYPLRSAPPVRKIDISHEHTTLEFAISPGRLTTLPLPLKFTVKGITFYDGNGAELDVPQVTFREGVLGSLCIKVPLEAERVRYVSGPAPAKRPTAEALDMLKRSLPKFESYVPEHEDGYAEVLRELEPDESKRAELDFNAMAVSGLVYTRDPLIAALQHRAGEALNESISGLGMGICSSLAYNCARRLHNLDIAALYLVGLVPLDNCLGFKDTETHAQTVAIARKGVGADGEQNAEIEAKIFDPTIHTQQVKIDSSTLSWSERAEALLQVQNGTFRDAYEISQAIKRRLSGQEEAQIGDDGGWHYYLKRLLHLGLVPTPPKDQKDENSGHRFVDDLQRNREREVKARGLQLLSYKAGLDRRVAQGFKARDFRKVYEYLASPLKAGSLTPEEARQLPKKFHCLADYDPVKAAIEFTNTALASGDFSKERKGECIEWLLGKMPRMQASGSPNAGNFEVTRDQQRPGAMSLDQAIAYATPEILPLMSSAQLGRYLEILTLAGAQAAGFRQSWTLLSYTSVTSYDSLGDELRNTFSRFFVAASRLTDELRARRETLPEEKSRDYTAINASLASLLLKHDFDKGGFAAPRNVEDYYLNAVTNLLLMGGEPAGQIYGLMSSARDGIRDRIGNIFQLRPGYLADRVRRELPAGRDLSADLNERAVAHLCARLDPAFDYAGMWRKLERMGLGSVNLSGGKESIESALVRYASQCGSMALNLPSADAPISALLSTIWEYQPAKKLNQLVQTLAPFEAYDYERLRRKWPAVSEEALAGRLPELIEIETSADAIYALESSKYGGAKRHNLFEILPLIRLATADTWQALTAIDYLTGLGGYKHTLNDAASRALAYPKALEFFTDKLAMQPQTILRAHLVDRLLEDYSKEQIYCAALWLGAKKIELRSQQGANSEDVREKIYQCTTAACEPGAIGRGAQEAQALLDRQLGADSFRLDGAFAVPASLRLAMLFADQLCYSCEERLAEALGRKRLAEALLKPISFHQQPVLTPKDAEKDLWRHLIEAQAVAAIPVKPSLEAARMLSLDNPFIGNMRTPYQKYLQSESAPFRPPSSSGGEFLEHRDYQPGDDVRHIDWNVYGRTDKFLIRRFEEREARSTTLVYDLRALAEGMRADEAVNPALKDLFAQIMLCEQERTKLDLCLVGRGVRSVFRDITARSAAAAGRLYESESFLNDLATQIGKFKTLLDREAELFGKDRVPGLNILKGKHEDLARNPVVVARLAGPNIKPTLGALEFLRKHGCHVTALRGAKD